MSIEIKDFVAFLTFWLAYNALLLGTRALWVLPSSLIVTYALMWAYYKWVNPPTKEKQQELQSLCQEKTSQTTCAHCQDEKK